MDTGRDGDHSYRLAQNERTDVVARRIVCAVRRCHRTRLGRRLSQLAVVTRQTDPEMVGEPPERIDLLTARSCQLTARR